MFLIEIVNLFAITEMRLDHSFGLEKVRIYSLNLQIHKFRMRQLRLSIESYLNLKSFENG